jgi:YD repeat-containing protein
VRVDGATEILVREPDGCVREWVNDGTEKHVSGRKFFTNHQVRVSLDGVVLDGFLAADDVEGWVERYRRDAEGRPVVKRWPDDPGGAGANLRCCAVEFETETLRGRVEFVWPEAPR